MTLTTIRRARPPTSQEYWAWQYAHDHPEDATARFTPEQWSRVKRYQRYLRAVNRLSAEEGVR